MLCESCGVNNCCIACVVMVVIQIQWSGPTLSLPNVSYRSVQGDTMLDSLNVQSIPIYNFECTG